MTRIAASTTVFSLLIAVGTWAANCNAQPASCGEPSCGPQGCTLPCDCGPACRLVCEMKKDKKTVWVVECEQFCAPLPSLQLPCCLPGADCTEEDCCGDACASLQRPMAPPICGKVRCRKVLVKKEVTCEVPVYRCVVCGTNCCDE